MRHLGRAEMVPPARCRSRAQIGEVLGCGIGIVARWGRGGWEEMRKGVFFQRCERSRIVAYM